MYSPLALRQLTSFRQARAKEAKKQDSLTRLVSDMQLSGVDGAAPTATEKRDRFLSDLMEPGNDDEEDDDDDDAEIIDPSTSYRLALRLLTRHRRTHGLLRLANAEAGPRDAVRGAGRGGGGWFSVAAQLGSAYWLFDHVDFDCSNALCFAVEWHVSRLVAMPALPQLTINPYAPAGERLSTASLYPLTGVVDDYLHSPRSPGTRSPSPSSPSRTSARRASTPMNLADGSLANLHRRSPSRHGDLSDGESALGDYDGAVAALELDFDDGGKGRRERYAGERRRAATEDGVTFGALQTPSSYSFPSSDSLQHVDSQAGYAYGSEDNLPLADSAALPAGYDESEWPSAPHESFAIQQPQFLSVTAPSRRSSSDLPRRSYPKGSPLGRSNTLQKAAAGLRRMSLRVVNLAGLPDVAEASPSTNAHPHRRLSDQEDGEIELGKVQEVENGATFEEEPVWVDDVLRGRTLYLFGPENRFRRACASLLRWK